MGPYMSAPKTTKEYDQGKNKFISFCAASMQGWRNTMEDSHIADIEIDGETAVFGVFDGHGGAEVALFVKEAFMRELKANKDFINRTKLEDALRDTFIQMDRMMITKEGTRKLFSFRDASKGSLDGDLSSIYAGCTANVALIYKKTLYVANSGDSRSVLSSNKLANAMSVDHKPDDKIELDRIRAAGGFVSEGRVNGNLNLSRAMGDFEYKGLSENGEEKLYCKEPEKAIITVIPDITKKELNDTDRFLLMGCDGIWETKSNQELIDFIAHRLDQNMSHQKILAELLDSILAKDCLGIGCDNMTSIIVLFKN